MPPVATSGDLQDEDSRSTERRLRSRLVRSDGRRSNHWATRNPDDYASYPRLEPLGYLVEARLFQHAQAGDIEARNTIWIHYARLTLSVVNRFRVPDDLLADAVQEGNLGFVRAIQKFDLSQLNSFSTYAWQWIYQHIQRFVECRALPFPIPAHLFSHYFRFRRELRLCHESGDEAKLHVRWTMDEPGRLRRLIRIHALVSAIAIYDVEPNDHPLSIDREPNDAPSPHELCQELLATLKQRDRRVLERRYGLNGLACESLREIGDDLKLTKERVRQIQRVAERRLRVSFRKLRYRFAETIGLPDADAPPEDE
jgi:RNA polymerase nonessential primary-like sigma factor